MATAADKQRTVVIALTLLFVVLIVGVSIWSPGGGDSTGQSAASSPTTVPFGPLGNGVATCEPRSSEDNRTSGYVIVYSAEEATPKAYTFRVMLTAQDSSQHEAFAQANDVKSARLTELAVIPEDASLIFVECRITGIQQDKRVLVANN